MKPLPAPNQAVTSPALTYVERFRLRADPRVCQRAVMRYYWSKLCSSLNKGFPLVMMETEPRFLPRLNEGLLWATARNTIHMMRSLLVAGASANCTSAGLLTPLHISCSPEAIELLLSFGASVTARDQRGDAPIHRLVTQKRPELVRALLKGGAEQVNDRIADGRAPIFKAIHDTFILELLIKNGADLSARSENLNLIDYALTAARFPFFEVLLAVKLLASYGLRVETTTFANLADWPRMVPEVIRTVVGLGMDPNAPLPNGKRPLHQFITNYLVVPALLECGADPRLTDNEGNTPLHDCVSRVCGLATMAQLIFYGADLTAKNNEGFAPPEIATGSFALNMKELQAQLQRGMEGALFVTTVHEAAQYCWVPIALRALEASVVRTAHVNV